MRQLPNRIIVAALALGCCWNQSIAGEFPAGELPAGNSAAVEPSTSGLRVETIAPGVMLLWTPRHEAKVVVAEFATFLALIQAFNAVFGVAVGRVLTLAFLMLQLVSAGGIYPVETTAKPFQIIHPFDPMTYAVNGLRQLTVGGIDGRLWTAVLVLGGILVASMAASSWAAGRNRQYTMERLHPPIEV